MESEERRHRPSFLRPRRYENTPFRNAPTAKIIPIKIRKSPITAFDLFEIKGVSREDRFLNDNEVNIVPTNIMAMITTVSFVILQIP